MLFLYVLQLFLYLSLDIFKSHVNTIITFDNKKRKIKNATKSNTEWSHLRNIWRKLRNIFVVQLEKSQILNMFHFYKILAIVRTIVNFLYKNSILGAFF